MPSNHASVARWAALGVVALTVVGCGHPATKQECEAIFDKSARLELAAANVTDAAEVARRLEAARVAKGAELTEGCVGRRITNRAMDCVREATSTEQFDGCLETWW
jgi:hypothetical protein